jgi:hypothetical protein
MYYTYSGSLSGRFFFGCDDNGATKDLNGTLDLNPYFVSGLLGSLTVNRWYLLVGFIHGSGYGTSPAGLGGVYDPVTGAQVLSATEFKMAAGVTFQKQRAYQYYTTTAGVQVYFARPRFEEVNGSEPSLALLLSPNGELAYLDQVDTPNVVNNAISQIGSNTNAAASTASCGPSGSADQDAVSFTIITTGAPVGIDISTTVTITNSGNNGGAAAWITVQRDGTDIGTAKWDGAGAYHAASYTAFSEGVSLNVIDAPALGSHVYTLHLHVQGSGTSGTFAMTATNSSIKVREYKK